MATPSFRGFGCLFRHNGPRRSGYPPSAGPCLDNCHLFSGCCRGLDRSAFGSLFAIGSSALLNPPLHFAELGPQSPPSFFGCLLRHNGPRSGYPPLRLTLVSTTAIFVLAVTTELFCFQIVAHHWIICRSTALSQHDGPAALESHHWPSLVLGNRHCCSSCSIWTVLPFNCCSPFDCLPHLTALAIRQDIALSSGHNQPLPFFGCLLRHITTPLWLFAIG